jgi:hypothetical protein
LTRATLARYSKSTQTPADRHTVAVDRGVLMLMAEILVRFGETHGRVPLRERMIAAARVAIAPVDHLDGHFRHVALRGVADHTRQLAAPANRSHRWLPRRRCHSSVTSLPAGTPSANSRNVLASRRPFSSWALPTMSLGSSPRRSRLLVRNLRPVRGARAALFLAGDRHEDQRGWEAVLWQALPARSRRRFPRHRRSPRRVAFEFITLPHIES